MSSQAAIIVFFPAILTIYQGRNQKFSKLMNIWPILTYNFQDSEITKNTNFSIHRQDRQDTSHPKKNGGGVATIIRNEIVTKRHFVTTIKILQYICLEIHITSLKIFLINIYFPFGYSNESSRELATLLRHISTLDKTNTIIMGDFNMPSISWSPDLNLPGVYLPTGTQTDEFFINLFFANDLKQIREPIANKNHLDLADWRWKYGSLRPTYYRGMFG